MGPKNSKVNKEFQSADEQHTSSQVRAGLGLTKILYYDCFAGISGDMNLGAMIDLGVDPDHLKKELSKLNIRGFHLALTKDKRKAGKNLSAVFSPRTCIFLIVLPWNYRQAFLKPFFTA